MIWNLNAIITNVIKWISQVVEPHYELSTDGKDKQREYKQRQNTFLQCK
jgi:hypothetical protein